MTVDATPNAAVASMVEAGRAFLDSLSTEQRSRATFPFTDHAERVRWYYFPTDQAGLPLGDMTLSQQMLAHDLVKSGLSPHAYARVVQIIAIENVLREIEGPRRRFSRDPGLYYLTVFGEPSLDSSWAWRFNGHHVCINDTLVDGHFGSATPLFLGSNPARITHDGYDILRPLGDYEEIARDLLDSLSSELRARAIVNERAPVDIVLGNLPHPSIPVTTDGVPGLPPALMRATTDDLAVLLEMRYDPSNPRGVPGHALSPGQRDLLGRLVRLYTSRFPDGVAAAEINHIDDVHFAWAGQVSPGGPHYYRLQGANLLVEYDNVQDGANHVHTVCRHPRDDFAADLLALHHLWSH